jgi:hypothetical protein
MQGLRIQWRLEHFVVQFVMEKKSLMCSKLQTACAQSARFLMTMSGLIRD